MSKSNLEDVEVFVHAMTERAVLVSTDEDEDNAVWLPKSQIEVDEDAIAGKTTTITAPEWLLQDRGLI